MALVNADRSYVVRWNDILKRKELRRRGYSTVVSDGGSITPGTPLAVSLASSPASPTAGTTVTLTATVSGGTEPYTPTWYSPPGVTLSGTGLVRTFVAPSTSTPLTFRVSVTDSVGSTQEATTDVTVQGSVSVAALYAGHVPNRVLFGYAGGANRPEWTEARTIIENRALTLRGNKGPASYEWRRFSGTNITGSAANATELRNMLAEMDAQGTYPWVSFKVINNDWAGVAAGTYAAIPAMFRTVANERVAAGKGPFMATLHHEPRGDGVLSEWASMHRYMSNQLADIKDRLAWSCIGNGFLWNQVTGTTITQNERAGMFPQYLIDTFRINKHVVAVDTYDDHPVYTGQQTYPVGGQSNRTSVKLQNWITWMRARSCGALGIGEWSTTDAGEMAKVAPVFWSNRDILGIVNYYNSVAGGSTWDWRIVPSNYPAYHAASNPADYGGTALTQGRLDYYTQMILDSTAAANTGTIQ